MLFYVGYQTGRQEFETTTSYSEEEDESETESDTGRPSTGYAADTPMSEEEERIFIKQDNGQFIAVRPSQVLFQKSHLAAALDPRNTGSRKKRPSVGGGRKESYEMSEAECDRQKT